MPRVTMSAMRCPMGVLLALTIAVPPLLAQVAGPDSTPAAVVQRFVDAANAADVGAMMTGVAPEAVFASLPGGHPLATGRDSVRAHYQRLLARRAPGFSVHVESRIAEGAFVVDHEHFQDSTGASLGHATWIYHVTGGFIRHAWVLRAPAK
jgi:hypothetical protein